MNGNTWGNGLFFKIKFSADVYKLSSIHNEKGSVFFSVANNWTHGT